MSSCCSWHENRQRVAIRKRLQELVRQVCRTAVQDKNAVHTVKQIQSISSYVVNKVTEACLRHPPTAICLQQQTRGHTILRSWAARKKLRLKIALAPRTNCGRYGWTSEACVIAAQSVIAPLLRARSWQRPSLAVRLQTKPGFGLRCSPIDVSSKFD